MLEAYARACARRSPVTRHLIGGVQRVGDLPAGKKSDAREPGRWRVLVVVKEYGMPGSGVCVLPVIRSCRS